MTIVPTKVSLIGSAAIVAGLGALAVVHRPASAAVSYHADASTSADITPALTSLGSPQISVNGQPVSTTAGTTTVPTPNGSTTVTVSGDSASVSTTSGDVNETTVSPSGNVHISVHSSTNGSNDASSSSFQNVSSNSFNGSSGFSSTSVVANGSGSVTIERH